MRKEHKRIQQHKTIEQKNAEKIKYNRTEKSRKDHNRAEREQNTTECNRKQKRPEHITL